MSENSFPKSWKVRTISDIAELGNGGTPPKSNRTFWDGGAIPFVTAADLTKTYVSSGRTCLTEAGLSSGKTAVCEPGDLLVGTRTRVGNCAIAKARMGASQDITRIRLAKECLPEFYRHYFDYAATRLAFYSQGTSILGITREMLNDLPIPVPLLTEQQRVVARIENLTRCLEETLQLRRVSIASTEDIIAAAISSLLQKRRSATVQLQELLVEQPRNGWSPPAAYQTGNGIPVLTLSSVTGFHYDGSKVMLTSAPTAERAHYWLKPNELLITRSNTPQLVGHAAIYDGSPARAICCDLIMKMKVNPAKADVRFIHYSLRSPAVRQFIARRAKGASGTMQKIGKRDVQEIPIPDVPIGEQHEIVTTLDALTEGHTEVRRLQTEIEGELAAFTPALLAKAFRGEL